MNLIGSPRVPPLEMMVVPEAIANAVVDEITQNAKADVKGGSSTGEHSII